MKQNIKSIFTMLVGAAALASCNVLDLKPLDSFTEDAIFSDTKLAETYVNSRYTGIRNGWAGAALRFVCDESMNNFNWESAYVLNRGEMTADNAGGFHVWNPYYSKIRECNIFMDNADKLKASSSDAALVDRLIGEIKFLRAYYYVELVNRYGGVPYITKTFSLEEDFNLKRDTYEYCVEQIVKECDEAAALLPARHSGENHGRATKGAALALKSKILLYAASPQWNPTNNITKWSAAAAAAKAVIDLKDDSGALVYELESDYGKMFLKNKSTEAIFFRLFTLEQSHRFDREHSPNGFNCWSAACVTQTMVDAYEMEDGTMPDVAKLYATEKPYEGRDPRFYASIVYNGAKFRGREVEFYLRVNDKGDVVGGGKDSERGGIEEWNYSKSRYTMRKFMDENLGAAWSVGSTQPWVFSRLGEIYLNYAEACCMSGDDSEARKYVNYIRARARGGRTGIVPDVTESGADLMERIKRERRIELAFEEHRYFDVRRWKIAEKTDNFDPMSIDIRKNENTGKLAYKIVPLQSTRKFIVPQHYLMPIPNDEIRKNSLLEQNQGYGGL